MFLQQKKQEEAQTPQPQVSGNYEYFGDPILPTGKHAIDELPERAQALINSIDVNSLPLNADFKSIIEHMQQETALKIAAKEIDKNAIPSRKITDMSQLSAEERHLLSTVLGQARMSSTPVAVAPPDDDVKTFTSPQALFGHVSSRLMSLDAAEVERAEQEEQEESPSPERKSLFTPSPKTRTESQPQPAVSAKTLPPRGMDRCPHCDLSLLNDPLEVTEAQKEKFVLSVVHNQPYSETVSFFGGRVQVTFNSMSTHEHDYVTAINNEVANRNDITPKEKYDFYLRSYFVFGVMELVIGDNRHTFNRLDVSNDIKDGVNLVINRCNEIIEKISNGELFLLLCNEVFKFNMRYRRLVSMGVNSDFWQPIQ